MSNFITFEHETKTSETSHEHVTLAFHSDGTIAALTREATRSVGRKWDMVGSYLDRVFTFTENSKAIRMAATQLTRKGGYVRFESGSFDPTSGEFRLIRSLKSDGRTTNPESLMGRIRDRSQDKKRASVQLRFGSIGTVDTTAMRAAIVARRAAR